MKNIALEQLKKRLRTLVLLIHSNKYFFRYLGVKRSLVIVAGSILFSLASTLNIVAFLPIFTFFTGTPDDFVKKYLVPFGITLSPENLQLIPYVVSGAVLVAFLLKFLFSNAFAYLCGIYSESYLNAIRSKLSYHAQASDKNRTSLNQNDFIHKLTIISRVGSLNWAYLNFLVRGLFALCSLFVIFKLDSRGLLFLLFYGALWSLILVPIMKRTRESSERYLSSLKSVNRFFLEDFVGHESFKVFRKTAYRSDRLSKIKKQIVVDNATTSILRQASASSQEVIIALALAILVIVVQKQSLQIDNLIAIGFLINRLSGALNEGVVYLSNSIEHLPAAIELEECDLLDGEPEKNLKESTPIISNGNRPPIQIHLQNFKPRDLNIKPVSIRLNAGDKVKIVGPNGIGKTTFMKSLMGLLPFEGDMKLNDAVLESEADILNLGIYSYIPQDPLIVQGTFYENIFLDSELTPEKEIKIDKLQAELDIAFSEYIPNWRTININERGGNLSGGQKQLISIIRTILNSSPVIILDEFTNHLSDKLKQAFTAYLNQYCSDKIILYVSHDSTFELEKQNLLTIQSASGAGNIL